MTTETLKQCPKCNRSLPPSDFNKDSATKDGLRCWCRQCTRADSAKRYREKPQTEAQLELARERAREWGRKNRARHEANVQAYRKRHPERRAARNAVYNAIKRGEMTKQPCEVCNDPEAQAHHDDYTKKLDVRWLCTTHHAERDVALRRGTV